MLQLIKKINETLKPFHVEIFFSTRASEDFSKYDKGQQTKILALIVKRAKTGPLIKPEGIGQPLKGELHGFSRIKPLNMKLRIIYRPEKNGVVKMGIIAIGPRDKQKVYKLAAERVIEFMDEMG
jgi:mRNA interferase RelE/StbE